MCTQNGRQTMMTDKKKKKKEQSSDGEEENDESSEQRYLLPPGLETDCFDLVRAWQFRRQQIRRGKFDDDEEEEEKDGGKEKRRRRDAKISSSPSSSSSSSKQRGGGKEEESPFQSFRLLYTERNFDRMFHLKTKFTNPNEQLQRLFDASLAIWDLANDRVFRKKEDKSPTSSSLIVGALYLLFMFYRRQPRRDVFFVSRGYRERAKVMEEDEELPKARVYVSLERMRELLGVLKRLEEEVEHNKKKKNNNNNNNNNNNKSSSSNEKTEEEDEDRDEDDDVEAALETLAIIKEMFADNAFMVGCTRPLTQRERRDLVESTKVVVNNELLEAYKEVRDEMVSLENGGIPGVQTLLEQTETYGKALDAILVNKQRPVSSTYAAGYLDPAKKIGGAVDRFAKRLEGKLEEILKAKPKQKRARKTPTPTETSTKVVTTTAGGLTVVNTKKITVITSAKEAPISSKRKKERRDLESMPDYYEKDEGN